MSRMSIFRWRGTPASINEGDRVTTLELFFDLVFVYAITQTVELMAKGGYISMLHALLIIGVLWWIWISYAWLGNLVRADEGFVRFGLLGAMAVSFVVAVTIPEAFHDLPGGLSGPLVFAGCYAVARVIHFSMFWACAGDDAGLRRQLLRSIPPWLGGVAMLVVAAFVHHVWWQIGLWVLALVIDLGGTLLNGMSGWRIYSAVHFAERHSLIVIVALGESIVSVGVGVVHLPISWAIIVALVLGVATAGALWWIYFDVTALLAEHALSRARGAHRSEMASHGYTYLHLPLVVGILLLAYGMKKVLNYVGDTGHHTLTDALHGIPLYALYGGVALYLLGHVAFSRRMLGLLKTHRLVAAIVVLALIPVANVLPALAALGLVTLVLAVLVIYETTRWYDFRENARHPEQQPATS
jgi:low temperature requirement protein LtrA